MLVFSIINVISPQINEIKSCRNDFCVVLEQPGVSSYSFNE